MGVMAGVSWLMIFPLLIDEVLIRPMLSVLFDREEKRRARSKQVFLVKKYAGVYHIYGLQG